MANTNELVDMLATKLAAEMDGPCAAVDMDGQPLTGLENDYSEYLDRLFAAKLAAISEEHGPSIAAEVNAKATDCGYEEPDWLD